MLLPLREAVGTTVFTGMLEAFICIFLFAQEWLICVHRSGRSVGEYAVTLF